MGTNTGIAGAVDALSQGAQGLVTGIESRQDAKIKKAEGDQRLKDLKTQADFTPVEDKLKTLEMQNEQLQNDFIKKDTFESLRAYTSDGDPRHLNQLLQKNPLLRELYGNVVSIDKLDLTNDAKLLTDAGLTLDDVEGNTRYLKITNPDGSKDIVDMTQIYGSTGYTDFLTDQELERLKITLSATRAAKDGRTAMQKNATAVAAAKDRIDNGKGTAADKELVRFGDKEVGGIKPGRADIAEETTQKLADAFGGEDKFFETDFGDQKNYNKAYPFVAKIEQLEGTDLSNSDKTMLHDIRALIAMGPPATKLTDAETGLMDNLLFDARKYISDDVTGIAATSAYLAFANSVRHALFGSALTESEIKSYREAYGSLKEKAGPVFAQFKTSLQQVKAKLQSVASMMNPYSAKVRLGVDVANLDYTIRAIDYRLQVMDSLGGKKKSEKDIVSGAFKP